MENKIEDAIGAKPVKKYLKIGAGILILGIIAIFGYPKYQDWKFNKELKQLTEEINKPYLEDTYGGKTPKETLEMFIAAVEKEDFDLASKYFVLSKQEEWREKLKNTQEKGNLNWLLENLKKMEDRDSISDDNFQMGAKDEKGIYMVFIDFIKYPQGIWKIQEI